LLRILESQTGFSCYTELASQNYRTSASCTEAARASVREKAIGTYHDSATKKFLLHRQERGVERLRESNRQLEQVTLALDELIAMVEAGLRRQRRERLEGKYSEWSEKRLNRSLCPIFCLVSASKTGL